MRTQIISITIAIMLMSWASTGAADVMAKVKTGEWDISVVSYGDTYNKSCRLELLGETYQLKKIISLKQQGLRHLADYGCMLFGPVQVVASPAPDYKSTYVIVEAARGGDGDHTGPILAIFQLTKSGFHQLGEKELFDAIYHRKNNTITEISGNVYFTFCDVCDGPSDGEYDFYVPAKITFGCGGMCFRAAINKTNRKILLKRFNTQKEKALEESDRSDKYRKYLDSVQKDLNEFLVR